MATKRDKGQSVLKSVLDLIPEAQRGAVESVFNDPTLATPVADFLGDAALRQADYSRQMDEARQEAERAAAWKANLDGWYAQQQEKLAEYETLKAGGGNPNPNPEPHPVAPAIPKDLVTAKDLDARLTQRDAEWAGFYAATLPLATTHFHRFGESLNVAGVMAHAQKTGKSFDAAYNEVYSEQLHSYATKLEQTKEQDLRKQIEEKVRAEYSAKHPYPTAYRQPDEPTVLDHMQPGAKAPDPSEFSADRAAAEYMQLVAARHAGGNPPSA